MSLIVSMDYTKTRAANSFKTVVENWLKAMSDSMLIVKHSISD